MPRKKTFTAVAAEPLKEEDHLAENAFAPQHGNYGDDEINDPNGIKITVRRNKGQTTLERWRSKNALNAEHDRAISLYIKCHRLCFDDQRVVAGYSPTASIRTTGQGAETRSHARIDAMNILKLIDEQVFRGMPPHRKGTFDNVVLWDQPASMSGAADKSRQIRQAAVKEAVLICAERIAHVISVSEYR